MSAPVPAAPAPAPAPPATPAPLSPGEKVLFHAAKIATEQDKPILLDYYAATQESGTAFLGQDKVTNEKILVKNTEEYTSPVQKMFKVATDYIIVTENSVYIVSGAIKKKLISS